MRVCKLHQYFTIKIACIQEVDLKKLKKLGAKIMTLRKAKKLTLCQICYQNGLEPSTFSRIEHALVDPKYLTLLKIAKALDVEINELFS